MAERLNAITSKLENLRRRMLDDSWASAYTPLKGAAPTWEQIVTFANPSDIGMDLIMGALESIAKCDMSFEYGRYGNLRSWSMHGRHFNADGEHWVIRAYKRIPAGQDNPHVVLVAGRTLLEAFKGLVYLKWYGRPVEDALRSYPWLV